MKLHLILLLTFGLFFTACGGSSSETSAPNAQNIAQIKIEAYANDNSEPLPTVQDYADAGVSGVTAENLAKINALVDALEAEDVDTAEEINALVTSLGINIVPIANAQSITLDEDTSKAVTLTATDTDGNDANLIYSVVTQPSHGTLSGTAPHLTYTPTANYFGSDSFTFKVNDGTVDSASATVAITVTDVVEQTLSLLKTGQTTQYEVFDDAYYEKGLDRSYTRDASKEVVTDNATGLMWQDDNDAKTITINHADAIVYCTNSVLGGFSTWRLPSIEELVYLTDKGRTNPALDPTFENVISNYYWSATTDVSNTSFAWVVYFDYGYVSNHDKSYSNYVRCVRDGQ